jgi:hypothetical protein
MITGYIIIKRAVEADMNMNQIINMVIRIVMRKAINKGINMGMGQAAKIGRKPKAQQPRDLIE